MSRAILHRTITPFLPLSFFEHQQLRGAMAPFRDAGIVFIHVPKTAGVSITRAIYHRTVWCHFTLPQLLKYGDEDIVKLPRFAIVRNPEGDPSGGPVAMRLGVGGSWSTVERTRMG